MFNISSYIFYNLSNLLFIFLIPNSFAKLFFLNYSIASGIFTFLIFYHFSRKNFFSEKSIMIVCSVILILVVILKIEIFTIWFFTFFVIYSDYFFSQRKNYILNFNFKLILMMSSLLLYQNFLDPSDVLKIKILIIYFTFVFYYFFCERNEFVKLKVNSPISYNFWTCFIYFSSLFMLTIIIKESFIKIIYISFQILIGAQLKLFDVKIRNIDIKYKNVETMFTIISFLYLVLVSIYSNLYFIIIFYTIVFLSLIFVKKKYIN